MDSGAASGRDSSEYADELREAQRSMWRERAVALLAGRSRADRLLAPLGGAASGWSAARARHGAQRLSAQQAAALLRGNRAEAALSEARPLLVPPQVSALGLTALADWLWSKAERSFMAREWLVPPDLKQAQEAPCAALVQATARTAASLYEVRSWRAADTSRAALLLVRFRRRSSWWEHMLIYEVGHVLPRLVAKRIPLLTETASRQPQYPDGMRQTREALAEVAVMQALSVLVLEGRTPGFALLHDFYVAPYIPGEGASPSKRTREGEVQSATDFCPQDGRPASLPHLSIVQERLDRTAIEHLADLWDASLAPLRSQGRAISSAQEARLVADKMVPRMRAIHFQTCHALTVAARRLRFSHNDLHGLNVMVTPPLFGPDTPAADLAGLHRAGEELFAAGGREPAALLPQDRPPQQVPPTVVDQGSTEEEQQQQRVGGAPSIGVLGAGPRTLAQMRNAWTEALNAALRERRQAAEPSFVLALPGEGGATYYKVPFAETDGRLSKMIDFGHSEVLLPTAPQVPGAPAQAIGPFGASRSMPYLRIDRGRPLGAIIRAENDRIAPLPNREANMRATARDARILLFSLVNSASIPLSAWAHFFNGAETRREAAAWLDYCAPVLRGSIFYLIYQTRKEEMLANAMDQIAQMPDETRPPRATYNLFANNFETQFFGVAAADTDRTVARKMHGWRLRLSKQNTENAWERAFLAQLFQLYQITMRNPARYLQMPVSEPSTAEVLLRQPLMQKAYRVDDPQEREAVVRAAEDLRNATSGASFIPVATERGEQLVFCNNVYAV